MRILSRYVLREFLTPVLFCLTTFASLYLVIELFGEFDKILPAKPPVSMILSYLGGVLSKDFQWIVTPSLLLGGLYAMWQLARHSEITAMRANGIGFSTITAPMLWAAFGFSILMFCVSEFYAPEASRKAERIKASGFKSMAEGVYKEVPYSNFVARRDWQVGSFDADSEEMYDVKITWTSTNGLPRQMLIASNAYYRAKIWWFEDAELSQFEKSGVSGAQVVTHFQKLDLLTMPELTEIPKDFTLEILQKGVVQSRENFSVRDMLRYVDSRKKISKTARTSWLYDIANRFAAPFACLVITLFAIPAGVASGRQSVFVGVLSAIILFLLYYGLSIFCGVWSKKGLIPISVGVLLPNLGFLVAGLVLFRRQR